MSLSVQEEARLTGSIMQWPDSAPLLRTAPPEVESHAFLATIAPGQAVWLTDEDVTTDQLPPGAVKINAPLAAKGLPSITITPGIKSDVSGISGGMYRFLDDKGELDAWMQEKVSNGYQLFGGILEHYVFERGESIADPEDLERALRFTWQVRNTIELDARVYSIKCEDVNRFTEQTAFAERYVRIIDDIEPADETIFVYVEGETDEDVAAVDWAWQHGRDYIVHPNERRAIGKLNDEFISWTGWGAPVDYVLLDGRTIQVRQLLNVERGLFGTQPVMHEVDFDSDLGSKPKITSVPYAEEHPLSLLLAVYCGITLDGREFPWGIGIPLRWIDVPSLIRYANEYRITSRILKSIDANEFVQKHCLARRGIMVPNPRGALQYVPLPTGQQGVPAFVLDANGVVAGRVGKLTHDSSETAIGVQVHWNQDPVTEVFKNTNEFVEPAALRETDATEMVEVEAPYLTTGRTTEAQVIAQARVLHARHARPVKRLPVPPVWDFLNSLPGTVLQVRQPVKDYQTVGGGVSDLDAPMMIGGIKINQNDRKLAWDMVGFRPLPSGLTSGGDTPLDDAEYTTGGTPLQVSGGVASLTQTIELNRKYYHLGDVRFPVGWPGSLVGNGDLDLWIKGVVEWAPEFSGFARGYAGGAGADVGAGERGVDGFTPAPSPSGSVRVETSRFENEGGDPQQIVYRKIVSRPAAAHTPTLRQIADTISVERGRVVGLPPTLSGSGGNGGDASYFRGLTNEPVADQSSFASDTGYLRGSNGGRSGIGIRIVCDPGSGFVGNGSMNVSGGPAAQVLNKNFTEGATGAGGARGHVFILHPTRGTPWPFSGTTLEARPGRASLTAATVARNTTATYSGPSQALIRSYYEGITEQPNEWADAHTVVFLPPSAITKDAFANSFDAFFDGQLDDRGTVYVEEARPSDGNSGDVWVTPDQLANGGQTPEIEAYVDGTGYVPVDWATTEYATVFRSMLAIAKRGGNTLHYGPEPPAEGEYTPGDEWHDSTTGLRYILLTGGGRELTGDGDIHLGANKFPPLSQYPAKQVIYGGEGDPVHPTNSGGAAIATDTPVGGDDYPALVGFEANSSGDGNAVGLPIQLAGDDEDATSIVIRRNGSVLITLGAETGYHLDQTTSPGTFYTYTANYTGPLGEGPARTATVTTNGTATGGGNSYPPLGGLEATPGGDGTTMQLTLQLAGDNQGATGIALERGGTVVENLPVNTTSHTDTELTPGTQYTYRAYYTGPNGAGPAISDTQTTSTVGGAGAIPTQPKNLVVTTSGGNNNLSWSASSDDVAVTGYNVFRGNTYLASVSTPSHVDTGNTSQTAIYTVEAYDADSNFSPRSEGATAGTGAGANPTTPQNLVVTTSGGNNNLDWDDSTDDVAVTGYNVFRGNQYLASVSSSSYVDTGNTSQTAIYTVEAYDADSNFSGRSAGATAG